ncbi:hypothetical protein [Geminocystis sp. GBBB08]|uniref:hypothetical protein n=1 Tax=Geminocystis sp. GBBB08 TaxID=2604140 RepID=UPI0027E25DE7|nr:hypothetical protein [Geminocystis sp. GBBB08]MBL1211471.1 hypothetical protein [Geminocystis sp. GBBB08]
MAKKSIVFREIKRLDKKKSPLKHQEKDFRMSKIMENFVKPYLHLASNFQEKEKLFTLGMIAWNASLYPQSERADIIDILFSQEVIGDDYNLQKDLTVIIMTFNDRKLTFFADYQRLIIDFDLTKVGEFYDLSVTSQSKE